MEKKGIEASNGNEDLTGDTSFFPTAEAIPKCLSSFIDEGSVESHRYYLSRRTVLEMLRDRGYLVSSSELDLSLEDFRGVYGQNPDLDRLKIIVPHKSDASKRMMVIFCGTGLLKVTSIRNIAGEAMEQGNLTGLILVVQSRMTAQAQKALDLFSCKVETFEITDLLINITKHVLKPKHQVLTDKEKEKLLKKYSIEEKQLPRLLKKDAIARYYGLERGQVVKVLYNDESTGCHITYRCVW